MVWSPTLPPLWQVILRLLFILCGCGTSLKTKEPKARPETRTKTSSGRWKGSGHFRAGLMIRTKACDWNESALYSKLRRPARCSSSPSSFFCFWSDDALIDKSVMAQIVLFKANSSPFPSFQSTATARRGWNREAFTYSLRNVVLMHHIKWTVSDISLCSRGSRWNK